MVVVVKQQFPKKCSGCGSVDDRGLKWENSTPSNHGCRHQSITDKRQQTWLPRTKVVRVKSSSLASCFRNGHLQLCCVYYSFVRTPGDSTGTETFRSKTVHRTTKRKHQTTFDKSSSNTGTREWVVVTENKERKILVEQGRTNQMVAVDVLRAKTTPQGRTGRVRRTSPKGRKQNGARTEQRPQSTLVLPKDHHHHGKGDNIVGTQELESPCQCVRALQRTCGGVERSAELKNQPHGHCLLTFRDSIHPFDRAGLYLLPKEHHHGQGENRSYEHRSSNHLVTALRSGLVASPC